MKNECIMNLVDCNGPYAVSETFVCSDCAEKHDEAQKANNGAINGCQCDECQEETLGLTWGQLD